MASASRTARVRRSKIILDEDSVEQLYGIREQLESSKFQDSLAKDLNGTEVSLKYIQENGFTQPMRILNKDGLGMTLPDADRFSIKTINKLVGKDREIYVQCCRTQTSMKMSMNDFVTYYLSEERAEIYNVLSLEFSDTSMNNHVHRPALVDKMDWIDLAYPGYLKKLKVVKEKMYYPKVQKYCLMSVASSYTTFHVDFGGTSVWYHVLKGKKIFWLIPPTDKNLKTFEKWNMANNDAVFLGDMVDECQRVELEAGHTFIMPSGWIHAVYTPIDSLVFGGNFLHSFNVPMQQNVVALEERTKVPQKMRFPLLNELHWFVLERYVYSITGISYLNNAPLNDRESPHTDIHLAPFEVEGVRKLVQVLEETKHVDRIEEIDDLISLHRAAKKMLADYQPDHKLAITGVPAIHPAYPEEKQTIERASSSSKPRVSSSNNGSAPRRATTCKQCAACLQPDCRECKYCHDMVKYGGEGKLRKSCVRRRCDNMKKPSKFVSPPKKASKRSLVAADTNSIGDTPCEKVEAASPENESQDDSALKKICGVKLKYKNGRFQSSSLLKDDAIKQEESNNVSLGESNNVFPRETSQEVTKENKMMKCISQQNRYRTVQLLLNGYPISYVEYVGKM